MEGQENQENAENGPPEAQKCCSVALLSQKSLKVLAWLRN